MGSIQDCEWWHLARIRPKSCLFLLLSFSLSRCSGTQKPKGMRPISQCLLVVALLCTSCALGQTKLNPLDAYVLRDDGCFAVQNLNVSYSGNGYMVYVWNFTSQCWLTARDSNLPVWWHYLAVVVPGDVTSVNQAFLFITGGVMNMGTPDLTDPDIQNAIQIAKSSRVVGAVLFQVPNQPLTFPWDPWHEANRIEDAGVAVTWWHFLQNTSQPDYVLELPMVKAGIRAMDALERILPIYNGGVTPRQFVVSGASKRGWTTWLVACVDAISKKRVKAIAPLVLDAINFHAFFHRQFQFYNGWTFALYDYFSANITQNIDNPAFLQLLSFIDPFLMKDRLTMPKLAINAVGDQFQMPDDQRHWASVMPGETNLLMIKNAEHSLSTNIPEVLQGLSSFVEAVVANFNRPMYQWSIDNTTGRITVKTSRVPKSVTVTYAASPQGVSTGKRDFRWFAVNATPCTQKEFIACLRVVQWATTNATMVDSLTYTALLPQVAGVWVGFAIELQWSNPSGPDDFYFTSPVSVIPNTYPFPDCQGAGCRGSLM